MKLLLAFAAGLWVSNVSALSLGDSAPLVTEKLQSVSGKKVSIKDIQGKKGTLVIFTCNHCPFSKAWETRYSNFGSNLALNHQIGVIAINSNDPKVEDEDGFEPMKAKSNRLGMKFPYVVDEKSKLARAYGAEKTPEFYLFDKNMKLIYHGAFDDNAEDEKEVEEKYLEKAVQEYLSGVKISKPETRARGCKIKFRS